MLRLDLLTEAILDAAGVVRVGVLLDALRPALDAVKADPSGDTKPILDVLGEHLRPVAHVHVIAKRDGQWQACSATDLADVVVNLHRLHRDDYVYDGRDLLMPKPVRRLGGDNAR